MPVKCPKCQADNTDTARFCSNCAAPLDAEAQGSPSVTKTLVTPVHWLAKGTPVAGKYRIVEEIGRGGMGIVYKAEDLKLKRFVALKFLPLELMVEPEARERFVLEAQAAAALSHPNICTIYEVSEAEDKPFIAMEYVEGKSLREKLKSGSFKTDEVLGIAIQVAEGLEEAHKKGIIHRDIKPANIMLTEKGQAKIMDFGLAKLTGVADVTKTLTVMGTPAYMSPEQARGEAVDQRTDIWQFGATLYEMLTGEMPFGRRSDQALLYSIVHETPEPLTRIRPEIPIQIERVVQKALEKDRLRRYQNMAEVLEDLKAVRTSGVRASQPEKSIIVLPFENISPDPEQDYFCDGLTEELISDLSKIHSLRVISRTSSMMLKGTKKDIPTIAREVRVRYVLEGSVRRAGHNLRITAQLIDAADDTHLWAEKYGGTLDDIFDIQEKVSHTIVDALKLKLTPEEAERLAERPIPDALSYEFYLKARQEILKYTEAGLENALRYLRSGLEIVGENAILYAGMAYVFMGYISLGFKEEDFCRKEAQRYINKTLALDPTSSLGHFIQGMLHAPNNPKKAIQHLRRVLETSPNDFDALFYLSCALGSLGQRSAVLPLEEKTIKIDPLNPAAHFHSGFNRIWEGEFGLARDVLGRLHQSFPEDLLIKFSYGLSLVYMNEREQAGLIFDQIAQDHSGGFFAGLSLAFKSAMGGKKSETLRSLEANPQLLKTRDFQYAYWIAECFALIDEKEKALDWLERDVNLGMINYPFLSQLDPFLANIRGEERFRKLMKRVKYEWEHFEE